VHTKKKTGKIRKDEGMKTAQKNGKKDLQGGGRKEKKKKKEGGKGLEERKT